MTDQDPGTRDGAFGDGAPSADPTHAAAKVAGVDLYSLRARIFPAILAAAPLLALGILALPLLDGAQKLWSITSLAVPAFAALLSRRAGNRAQVTLYESWGGAPTTQKLRYSSSTSPQEISRRHERLRLILGDAHPLPDQAAETADPEGSDRRYADAVRRLLAKVRNHPDLAFVNLENRNYGFARNLLGLKALGIAASWVSLITAAAVAITLAVVREDVGAGSVMLLPAAVSVIALFAWRMVDGDYVRPCADAYANAVIEALDVLPNRPPAG